MLLPCVSGGSLTAESGPLTSINDTSVDTIIRAIDEEGEVVDEIMAVMMEF